LRKLQKISDEAEESGDCGVGFGHKVCSIPPSAANQGPGQQRAAPKSCKATVGVCGGRSGSEPRSTGSGRIPGRQFVYGATSYSWGDSKEHSSDSPRADCPLVYVTHSTPAPSVRALSLSISFRSLDESSPDIRQASSPSSNPPNPVLCDTSHRSPPRHGLHQARKLAEPGRPRALQPH
jgi:hypothetical protein